MNALEAVADRIGRGDVLSEVDARAVLATNDIIEVAVLADAVRRQRRGKTTTFVRVFETHVEVPATSLPAPMAYSISVTAGTSEMMR